MLIKITSRRYSSNAGIAIGPILFAIALLGILTGIIMAGSGEFGTSSVIDRVGADIPSQANLIRSKLNECNLKYTSAGSNEYPDSGGVNVAVSALQCPGDVTTYTNTMISPAGFASAAAYANLWDGARMTALPTPPIGFEDGWFYFTSAGTGGTCFWIKPKAANPLNNSGIVNGLSKAANLFTHQATCTDSTSCHKSEVLYNSASASQKFVVWMILPTGTPDSNCLP